MLKKAITKSGLRILRAIKKLSTKTKKQGKKCSQSAASVPKISSGTSSWISTIRDNEAVSLSWSLASLDTKSIDTYLTVVSDENVMESPENCYSHDERKCCCCCAEYEENQRNENRENEMFA